MILTIQLHSDKLQHMKKESFGAFVAHCYSLKNFHSIECWKTAINVSFALGGSIPQVVDQAKIQAQLEAELGALAELDPHPCPCGCGAFITITACLRQSGVLSETIILNDQEREMIHQGNKISAIKSLRERSGAKWDDTYGANRPTMGLKEAKDLCDLYEKEIGR
jgi:hypothetical protein